MIEYQLENFCFFTFFPHIIRYNWRGFIIVRLKQIFAYFRSKVFSLNILTTCGMKKLHYLLLI